MYPLYLGKRDIVLHPVVQLRRTTRFVPGQDREKLHVPLRRLCVDRAKAEQRSRPTYKPRPDHPWRRPFKPEATGVTAG